MDLITIFASTLCLGVFYFSFKRSEKALYILMLIANIFPPFTGFLYNPVWVTWLRIGIIFLIAGFLLNKNIMKDKSYSFPLYIKIFALLYLITLVLNSIVNKVNFLKIFTELNFAFIIIIYISFKIFSPKNKSLVNFVHIINIIIIILFLEGFIDQFVEYIGYNYTTLPIWDSITINMDYGTLLKFIGIDKKGILYRSKGAYAHNLYYASVLLALLPISLNMYFSKRSMIPFIINMIGLVIANSRGCLILAFPIIAICIFFNKGKSRTILVLLFLSFFVSIFLAFIIPVLSVEGYTDYESYGRKYFYSDIRHLNMRHFLFGVGSIYYENKELAMILEIHKLLNDVTFTFIIQKLGIICLIGLILFFVSIILFLLFKTRKFIDYMFNNFIFATGISLIASIALAAISNSILQTEQGLMTLSIITGIALKLSCANAELKK